MLQSEDFRLKLAKDISVTSQIVHRSKLSPFSFLSSRGIDRLTKSSLDLTSYKPHYIVDSDKAFDSSQGINNIQPLVHATITGFVVHSNVSPETQALFKEASILAASVPTPNSKSSSN